MMPNCFSGASFQRMPLVYPLYRPPPKGCLRPIHVVSGDDGWDAPVTLPQEGDMNRHDNGHRRISKSRHSFIETSNDGNGDTLSEVNTIDDASGGKKCNAGNEAVGGMRSPTFFMPHPSGQRRISDSGSRGLVRDVAHSNAMDRNNMSRERSFVTSNNNENGVAEDHRQAKDNFGASGEKVHSAPSNDGECDQPNDVPPNEGQSNNEAAYIDSQSLCDDQKDTAQLSSFRYSWNGHNECSRPSSFRMHDGQQFSMGQGNRVETRFGQTSYYGNGNAQYTNASYYGGNDGFVNNHPDSFYNR